MDIDVTWHGKRPIEDEQEYQDKKRFLSERFFNMRISEKPSVDVMHHPLTYMGGTAANGGDIDDMETVDEVKSASFGTDVTCVPTASDQMDTGIAGFDENNDSDLDDVHAPAVSPRRTHTGAAPNSSRGDGPAWPQSPHPFYRSASSPVDDKVEDWVRQSRKRLMNGALVGVAPDVCQSLTIYKPLSIFDSARNKDSQEEESDGEAGGNPTPTLQATGNDAREAEAVSSTTAGCASADTSKPRMPTSISGISDSLSDVAVQSAGSGSSEAAASVGGGGNRNREWKFFEVGDGTSRGLQSGSGLWYSAGDDVAGGMTDAEDSADMSAGSSQQDVDAMDMVLPVDDESMGCSSTALTSSALTRVGTSPGVPAPEITPELAALARTEPWTLQQEPRERASGPAPAYRRKEGAVGNALQMTGCP